MKLNSRSLLLLVLALGLLTGWPLTACDLTPAPKIWTVGIVSPTAIMNPVVDGFKTGMIELGYVEGQTITYVYDGPVARDALEQTTKDLVAKKVDLILAITTPGTQAAMQATAGTNIPVVFVPVTDPVDAGLVTSLKQPGGNLTGITTGAAEPQRFEWLLRIVPEAKRIYLPYNPNDKSPVTALGQFRQIASGHGVELVLREASNADEVKAAIQNIPADMDAIYIGPDSMVGSLCADWVTAAIQRKLPLSGSSFSHVEAGMLFSYSFDTVAVGKQAARLADQILKGTKPADLPVETSEFFLSLNLKTADAIGLNIPDDILRQAKEVIR